MAGTKRRLYVGELSSRATERDLEDEFGRFGKIAQITMKTGFCFLEFEDDLSADDAQRAMDSAEFMGRRLRVEFSRPKPTFDGAGGGGDRDRDRGGDRPSYAPRGPTSSAGRTDYRVIVTGMHPSTSWQDLKDFARQVGQVLYTAVRPDDRGSSLVGVVEYSTPEEMREALRSLDGARIRGDRVRLDPEGPQNPFNLRTGYRGGGGGGDSRARSRSRERAPPSRSDRDRDSDRRDDRGSRDDDRDRRPRDDDGGRDRRGGGSERRRSEERGGRGGGRSRDDDAPEAAAAPAPEVADVRAPAD